MSDARGPGAELEAALSSLASETGDHPAVSVPDFHALARQLDAETGPAAWLRSRSTSERFGVLIAVAVAASVVAATLGGWTDLALLAQGRLVLEFALLGGFALLGMAGSVRGYHHRELPRWMGWGLIGATLVVPLALALMPMPSAEVPEGAAMAAALGCLMYGLAIAAPVLLVAWVLDRGSWRGRPSVRYAASAAGLAGLVGLQLHCPVHHAEHLMVGHLPVVLAMLGTAAVLGVLSRR